MERYSVFLNGNRICPKCSSMMTMFHGHRDIIFKCMDCKSRFVMTDEHESNDKEMILDEVSA